MEGLKFVRKGRGKEKKPDPPRPHSSIVPDTWCLSRGMIRMVRYYIRCIEVYTLALLLAAVLRCPRRFCFIRGCTAVSNTDNPAAAFAGESTTSTIIAALVLMPAQAGFLLVPTHGPLDRVFSSAAPQSLPEAHQPSRLLVWSGVLG